MDDFLNWGGDNIRGMLPPEEVNLRVLLVNPPA